MTAAIVLGSNSALFQGKQRSWSPDEGVTSIYTYRGPRDKISDLFISTIGAAGVSRMVEAVENSGKASGLTITYADDAQEGFQNNETDASTWELVSNEVLKALAQHPYFANNLSAGDLTEVEDAISKGDGAFSPDAGAQTNYYNLRIRGTENYLISQPVIRKTVEKAADNQNITIDYANTDRVVTLASIGAPAAILGALDTLTTIDSDGDPTTGSFEWLKKFPQTRITNGRRLQIIYEWWGAQQWSQLLYGGTLTP